MAGSKRPGPPTAVLTTAAVVAAVVALAGCTSLGSREDAAARAVEHFEAVLRAGDAEKACSALAPGTLQELEDSAEAPCPRALTEAGLPDGGRAERVDVYGREARVVLVNDTLFLSTFPGGWKITAAGCEPRAGKPYTCQVKGE
ncbi:hypothetical protein [Streptomyces sp. NPDC003023]|uniref:hypothetical protein n=1 Tax=Streptomyces sp. NPDC003023 TaxID=3364675 RepID=UPI00369FA1D3